MIVLLILWSALYSCSNDLQQLDTRNVNEWLSTRSDIENAEDLIREYYGDIPEEGNSSVSVERTDLIGSRTQVTLLHDGLLDDSQKAVQLIMAVQKRGQKWEVLEMQKNWKCHPGRGHTEWGIEPCS